MSQNPPWLTTSNTWATADFNFDSPTQNRDLRLSNYKFGSSQQKCVED